MSLFDDRAADWDTPDRIERARAVAAAIRERLPLSRAMQAIEVGAGTGLLGMALAPELGSVVLADPSEGMVAVARSKIETTAMVGVTAIVYDLPSEPPPGAPFDLVFSLLMLHHIEDTAATLRSIHAMLGRGGRLALADLDAEDGTFHEAGQEGVHHQGFDQARLRQVATEAGFVDVRSEIIAAIERDGREWPLFLLMAARG